MCHSRGKAEKEFGNTTFNIIYNLVGTGLLAEVHLEITQIIIQKTVCVIINIENGST